MFSTTLVVDDMFKWSGSLKDAPDWVADMVGEGDAMISKTTGKMISIKYKNGYAQADPGDIIVRVNKDIYSVIHVK
jgi:hypothetical protein